MSRTSVETELYSVLDKITQSNENSERYKSVFANMSDQEFRAFFKEIEEGKRKLCIYIPNHGKSSMDFSTIIREGEKLGCKFYGHIVDEIDGVITRSSQEVMVLKSPIRRLAQSLDAKISLPAGDSKVDAITGQVAGDDRAASISSIELSVLTDIGLTKTSTELATVRGGDAGAYSYLKAATVNTGMASLASAMDYRTGVGARQATKVLLLGKHIKTNL